MAALGTFTLVVDGEQLDGTAETKARLHLTAQGPGTIRDPDGDEFKFPAKFAKAGGDPISLPYPVTLFTDTAVGEGDSTTIGYEGYVATGYGRVEFQFAAPQAGSTVNLVDLTDSVVTPISDLQVFRDEAEAARDEAVAAAATVPSSATLAATYAKPAKLTMALLGDSITNQNNTYQLFSGTDQWLRAHNGWFNYANTLIGNKFSLVTSTLNEEFGASGLTAAQLVSGGYVSAVVAANPGWCHLHVGTNDIFSEDVTAAVAATRIQGICDTLLNAGIRVILGTVLPRSGTETAAKHQKVRDTNALLRTYAASRPGLVLNDWYSTLIDPATSKAGTTYLYDGTHPSGLGAQRMGVHLSRILAAIAPGSPRAIDETGLLASWYNGGTGGGFSGSNPGGGSGVIPANGTVYVDTGTTVVGSKVARTDEQPGEWFQLAVSAAAGNGGAKYRQKNTNPAGTPPWGAGDTVYAVAEYQTDAAGWSAKTIMAWLGNSSTAAYAAAFYLDATNLAAAPVARQDAFASGIIRTPSIVIPAGGWAQLLFDVGIFGGAGTLRIGRVQIYKA